MLFFGVCFFLYFNIIRKQKNSCFLFVNSSVHLKYILTFMQILLSNTQNLLIYLMIEFLT